MTLGGRIVLARESANMTRADLARRIGVLGRTVENWEADRSEPRGNRLTTLAGVLGTSFLWLVTGDDSAMPEIDAGEETRTLARKLDRLKSLNRQADRLAGEIKSDLRQLQSRLDAFEA